VTTERDLRAEFRVTEGGFLHRFRREKWPSFRRNYNREETRTMTSQTRRLALVLLLAPLFLLLGCSGKSDKNGKGGDGSSDAARSGDVKTVGMALLDYSDSNKKGPARVEDLVEYLMNDEKLIAQVRSGDIVAVWNVSVIDLNTKPGGSPSYVIAYEKDVPTKGGFVVMGDTSVKKVSPDEFKTLKLAKPGK
jgi:hypothetical protein